MQARQKMIEELAEFIGFASVSSRPQNPAIIDCANWLVQHFKSIGMQQAVAYKTGSHPVVYASHHIHPSAPTILFYGHYDVQPDDPADKWNTLPFEAVVKGNYIYGRGASDDKGQVFIHIKAVEQLLILKTLRVNVKFLIEGAEEIGSVGLKDFIRSNKALLQNDAVVVSDTKMAAIDIPAITWSLRGSLNAEIVVQTANKDLHSGTFGGYVPNAAITLSNFISNLFNKDLSIAIPGFYDDVKILSAAERKLIKVHGISDKKLVEEAEAFSRWGEEKYSLQERVTTRPSLAVTGIISGFQGTGVKNIIPSIASVKLNFRLVPYQQPEKIKYLLDKYIEQALSQTRIKKIYSSFNNPVSVPLKNSYIKAAVKACEKVFGQPVKYMQNGGTIGAVEYLHTILKTPVILLGFAQATDNMHAPDERFYLPNFFRGIDTIKAFINNVALLKHQTIVHDTTPYY